MDGGSTSTEGARIGTMSTEGISIFDTSTFGSTGISGGITRSRSSSSVSSSGSLTGSNSSNSNSSDSIDRKSRSVLESYYFLHGPSTFYLVPKMEFHGLFDIDGSTAKLKIHERANVSKALALLAPYTLGNVHSLLKQGERCDIHLIAIYEFQW